MVVAILTNMNTSYKLAVNGKNNTRNDFPISQNPNLDILHLIFVHHIFSKVMVATILKIVNEKIDYQE